MPMLRALRLLAFAPLLQSHKLRDVSESAPPARPLAVIDLEHYRTRWAMNVDIGGRTRKFIFDTGGGLSFVSKPVADAIRCTPWGRITGYNMFGHRGDGPRCDNVTFGIGGQRYTAPTAGIIDLGKLNPLDSALDGLIALDIFAGKTITLDLGGGHVIVESDASKAERIRDMKPWPIHLNREVEGMALTVHAAVPTTKGTLWMELDSGNGGTILVSRPVAELVGLDSAVRGKQSADFAVLRGVRVRSDDAMTPDMIFDGNLGMPFLRDWIVTVDLEHGKAWIGRGQRPEV